MKRTMKLFLLLIISFLAGVIIIDKFDKREFRFEDFKTAEETQNFLKERYLNKTDYRKIIKDLQAVGSSCINEKSNVVRCVYSTGWLSRHPLTDFIVVIEITNDNKVGCIKFNKGYVGL